MLFVTMEHKGIVASGVVLVLIILGMFVFTYVKKTEIAEKSEDVVTYPTPDKGVPYSDVVSVDVKHFYKDGTHTVVGEILMPTPCDLLAWDTRILESYPEHVIIDFTVVNHADVCAEVVMPQHFSVSFTASEQAILRATFMGREIRVNEIPVDATESPESYELFRKE